MLLSSSSARASRSFFLDFAASFATIIFAVRATFVAHFYKLITFAHATIRHKRRHRISNSGRCKSSATRLFAPWRERAQKLQSSFSVPPVRSVKSRDATGDRIQIADDGGGVCARSFNATTPLPGKRNRTLILMRLGVSLDVFADHVPCFARPILVPDIHGRGGSGGICRLDVSKAGGFTFPIRCAGWFAGFPFQASRGDFFQQIFDRFHTRRRAESHAPLFMPLTSAISSSERPSILPVCVFSSNALQLSNRGIATPTAASRECQSQRPNSVQRPSPEVFARVSYRKEKAAARHCKPDC